MQKSKLIKLFYCLDKKQKSAFRKFIHSPFYNLREDLQSFWDYLVKHEEKRHFLSKEHAFSHLYPNRSFDDQEMRHLMSFLLRCLESFLIVQNLPTQGIEARIRLLRAYRELDLGFALERTQQQLETLLQQYPYRDSQYWIWVHQLELEVYRHSEEGQRSTPRNLQELTGSLDIYYMSEKLKLSCLQFAHQSVYKIEYDYGLLPFVLDFLKNKPEILKEPALGIYYHYYYAVSQNSESDYFAFAQILEQNEARFEAPERCDLYLLAINYGIRQINQSKFEYLQHTLDWYKRGLQRGVLIYKGELSRFSFKNMLAIAFKAGDYDWAEQALQTYPAYLDPQHRDNYLRYGLSKLAFSRKDYAQARSLLVGVEYDELFMNIDAKIMLMKLYYEQNELEALENLLHSFRVFLRRKRNDLAYHYENYQNLVQAMALLSRLNPHDRKDLVHFEQRIEGIKILTERDWLLEQLAKRKAR